MAEMPTEITVKVDDLLKELDGIDRLRLEPGDVLVLLSDKNILSDNAKRISATLTGFFESRGFSVPVLVLDGGLRLAVVNIEALHTRALEAR